jgi:cell wall-associated NlpC family hydrolase
MIGRLAEQFAAAAESYAADRVVYQHRGTTRQGVDCTGLIIAIAREIGFLGRYELRPYPPDWNLHSGAGQQLLVELEKVADRIRKVDADRGDVAVIFWGKCPAHCGILVAGGRAPRMVHSYYGARSVRHAMLVRSPWSKRWVHTYRLNEEKLRNV